MVEKLKEFKLICKSCKSKEVYYNGTTKQINVLCNSCGKAESLKLDIVKEKEVVLL